MLDQGDALGPFPPARISALFAPLRDYRRIGLAVSGGPDSLALLLLFAAWAPDGPKPEAIVYTVDHGLRPEAADEARAVVAIAARLGLTCRVLRWDGPKPPAGLQQAARDARYRLIATAMAADGGAALVVAHNLEDQAETVLMRLAHGSGPRGLTGMRAHDVLFGMVLLRPLLAVARREIEAVVTAAGLKAARDPSNTDTAYERVRWRQALPELAALGLTADRLALFARRLGRIDGLARKATASFLDAHLASDAFGVFTVLWAGLRDAEEEIAVRALGSVLAVAGGGQDERLDALERLVAELRDGGDVARTMMGAKVTADRERVTVFREAGRMGEIAQGLEPGETVSFDGRFVVTAKRPGLVLRTGRGLARRAVEAWLGAPLGVPMPAIAAAPVVVDADGTMLALGTIARERAVVIAALDPRAEAAR